MEYCHCDHTLPQCHPFPTSFCPLCMLKPAQINSCIWEGCLCPQGKFNLWSAVCLLCPSDPLCNQSVCLQTACLLCLLLLEVHLVTTCILLNNHLYQLFSVLTHIWTEGSQCTSVLDWSCVYGKGLFPIFFISEGISHPFPSSTPKKEAYFFLSVTFPCFSLVYLIWVDVPTIHSSSWCSNNTSLKLQGIPLRVHSDICSSLNFSHLCHLKVSLCALPPFLVGKIFLRQGFISLSRGCTPICHGLQYLCSSLKFRWVRSL